MSDIAWAFFQGLGSPLDVQALDPEDPPLYESQAFYLERLNLLLPGERRRLKPKDFKPESVVDILSIETGCRNPYFYCGATIS